MIKVQVTMEAPWQLLAPNRYPLQIYWKPRHRAIFYLRVIFVRKVDARKWATLNRWRGGHTRVQKLARKIRQEFGWEYKWGVWMQQEESG